MSQKSVFCVAASHQQAERIVDQLKTAHFTSGQISLLYPDADTAHDSAHVLLSVSTGSAGEVSRAKAIFISAGAGDICTSGEAAWPETLEHNAPLHAEPVHAAPSSSVRYNCPA